VTPKAPRQPAAPIRRRPPRCQTDAGATLARRRGRAPRQRAAESQLHVSRRTRQFELPTGGAVIRRVVRFVAVARDPQSSKPERSDAVGAAPRIERTIRESWRRRAFNASTRTRAARWNGCCCIALMSIRPTDPGIGSIEPPPAAPNPAPVEPTPAPLEDPPVNPRDPNDPPAPTPAEPPPPDDPGAPDESIPEGPDPSPLNA